MLLIAEPETAHMHPTGRLCELRTASDDCTRPGNEAMRRSSELQYLKRTNVIEIHNLHPSGHNNN